MNSIGKKFAMTLIVFLVGIIVGMQNNEMVYAEENSASDAGYFNIYAWVQSCSYYDGQPVDGSCSQGSGSITSSDQITVRGNGAYEIKNEKNSNAIKVKIENNVLKIEPDCALFNSCPSAISVNLSGGATSVRQAVNNAMQGVVWNKTEQAVGSSYSVTTRYTFSATDVTKIEEVQVPDNDLAVDLGVSSGNSGTGASDANCMNSGAADTLGWIVCPALSFLSGASQWLYYDFVEPALRVDPKLFKESSDGTNGTFTGWEAFRNIANSVLIVLFLVVIFSQLTGVGIDNYGIKKILPKLIIAAILMNLSYWICVAFVDLSNIVGNGFQRLFTSLGSGLTMPSDVGGVTLGSIESTTLTGVVVIGVLSVGIWGVVGGEGMMGFLLALLVAAISAVVALFFLFLLLAAREAAIVVLTVISPLAFACYMLPNTKNLFDKWWKLGQALLLVYPICGLLVGGGDFVSKLLLSAGSGTGDFFSAFAAMIVGVVPIFFIPTVLKQSFAAMGNLGAKISGIGQRVGGRLSSGAGNAVRGTERFKNYQADRSRQRKIESARRTAARYMDENQNVRPGLSVNQARRFAQAQSILLGEEAETLRRERLMDGGYDAEAEAERVKHEEALVMNDAGLRDNIGALQMKLEDAITEGDNSRIRAYQNVLSRKGDDGREAVRSAMINAQSSGRNIGSGAVQTYASNLMNNWASDYKDNNRSTYDYASGVLGGTITGALDPSSHASIGSLKTSQVANMDEGEFKRLVEAHVDANGVADPEFANLCYSTLHDSNAMTGAKRSRLDDIEKYARQRLEGSEPIAQQQAAADIVRRTQQSQQDQLSQNLQNARDISSQQGGNIQMEGRAEENGEMSIGHGGDGE